MFGKLTLEQMVREGMKNAKENGFTFETPEEWVEDMLACDADLEGYTAEELAPIVNQIFAEENKTKSI